MTQMEVALTESAIGSIWGQIQHPHHNSSSHHREVKLYYIMIHTIVKSWILKRRSVLCPHSRRCPSALTSSFYFMCHLQEVSRLGDVHAAIRVGDWKLILNEWDVGTYGEQDINDQLFLDK